MSEESPWKGRASDTLSTLVLCDILAPSIGKPVDGSVSFSVKAFDVLSNCSACLKVDCVL